MLSHLHGQYVLHCCLQSGAYGGEQDRLLKFVRQKVGFHGQVTSEYNLSGRRWVPTDKSHQIQLCPAEGGIPRTNHTVVATLLLSHLHGQYVLQCCLQSESYRGVQKRLLKFVRQKAGSHGQVTSNTTLSGRRRGSTDKLHSRGQQKSGKAVVALFRIYQRIMGEPRKICGEYQVTKRRKREQEKKGE